MAYPDSYEFITDLTYNDCVLYSHKLTDGFLEDDGEYEISKVHNIYAKHLSTSPLLSVYDDSGVLIATDLPGTYISELELHKFGLDLSAWDQTGKFILKLYSNDYPTVFTKVVQFTDCSVCSVLNANSTQIGENNAMLFNLITTNNQIANKIESLTDLNQSNTEEIISSTGKKLRVIY